MIGLLEDTGTVTEALRHWRGREAFPVDLSSAELRGFSRELWQRSIISARTTNAEYLGEIAAVVDDMLAGKIEMAEARYRLTRKLKLLGYDPAVGFPQDMAAIPPAERGSLQDLSSDARISLVLETNLRMAANYGRMVEGNSAEARAAYPAWELVRLYRRATPRGSAESGTAGWEVRWRDAGEATGWQGALERPMLARKDSPIWQALGDGAGGHTDTLGNPFPPFAFNSGMGWATVERERCAALGLISGREVPGRMAGQLAPDGRETAARLPADLLEELRREAALDKEGETLRQAREAHLAEQERRRRALAPAGLSAEWKKTLEAMLP